MSTELINLMPSERVRAFRRDYFLRLIAVAVLLLAGVVVIQGVLLLPSYLYLHQQITARKTQLDALTASLSSSDEAQASARVSALQKNITYLTRLSNAPYASTAIRAVLAVPHPGIVLTGFTYTPPRTGSAGRMEITGVSNTREALRSYNQALSVLPFVTSADLPISAYASESNIHFTITLSGTLTP